MTIHLHLLLSHAASVAAIAAVAVLITAHLTGEETVFKLGYGFVIATALASATAYFTGPPSYEALQTLRTGLSSELVENHALVGRAAFIVMVLVGVVSVAAALQYVQDDVPSRAHRWAVLIGLMLACLLLAWAAHVGGAISHPEIR